MSEHLQTAIDFAMSAADDFDRAGGDVTERIAEMKRRRGNENIQLALAAAAIAQAEAAERQAAAAEWQAQTAVRQTIALEHIAQTAVRQAEAMEKIANALSSVIAPLTNGEQAINVYDVYHSFEDMR